MKKKLSSHFNTRQYMTSPNYEIFYFHDLILPHVSMHKHDHYEFYYFLEGDLDYEVDGMKYDLKPGDYMLIPPGNMHGPHIYCKEVPYRRIVLWLSRPFYDSLCGHSSDFAYGYEYVLNSRNYHFRHDSVISQDIQGQMMELMEEIKGNHAFHELHCQLKTATFLAYINRVIYEKVNASVAAYETPLYLLLCDYINSHLTEELSLDVLAAEFYVSKYHIAHTFKEHMGIGLHQYIVKKRLQAIKSNIPSGTSLARLSEDYGFRDYTTFYRAFRKEYHISPKEYKDQHKI